MEEMEEIKGIRGKEEKEEKRKKRKCEKILSKNFRDFGGLYQTNINGLVETLALCPKP